MEKMFDLDVQVQSASKTEVAWFTQSLFCSLNSCTDEEQM